MKVCVFATKVMLLTGWSVSAQNYGDFPYNQSFTSGVQPPEVSVPSGSGTNDATFTTDGLRLTRAVNNLFGAVFINNRQFSSINGIIISFDYVVYGGTGADGFSVFLFDADVSSPTIGSSGRQLGYAYNRANNSFISQRRPGLSGAYLGVGLDMFGNNKGRVFQTNERMNGVLAPSGGWGGNSGRSHITLRGAKGSHIANDGRSEGYTGYPVLITKSTFATGSGNGSATLNSLTGAYTYGGGTAADFNLRGGALPASTSEASYRRAIIELLPDPDVNIGGFLITVKIRHGATTTTVIDGYSYRTNPLFPTVSTFTYTENANASGGDFNTGNTLAPSSTHALDTNVPEFLRVGFAASTGGLNDIHLIRNLTVVLPYAAEANDDEAAACNGSTAQIDALANDIAYSGPIATGPTGSSTNIDPSAFTFHDENEAPTPNPYQYTNSFGIWEYAPSTRLVSFMPAGNQIGEAAVSYSVKGSNGLLEPYGDEAYRSLPATIRVNVKRCGAITNPILPSKTKQ